MESMGKTTSSIIKKSLKFSPQSGPPSRDHALTTRSPPPLDYIKINVDAALTSSKSALAVVARNHLGEVLFIWGKENQLCSPLQVEAMALLWAVHLVIQNCWYSVMFEGDSKICFDALNHSDQTTNWSIDTIICNICSFSSCFTSCSFG